VSENGGPGEGALIALVAEGDRGPMRDGLFAVWLTLRAAQGILPPQPLTLRNHRRRLMALDARLATLALPTPLRRALVAARQHLEPGTPNAAALVLTELVAPAREVLGPAAGDAVAVAARAARIHL
jgi:hypothetical protein